MRTINRASRIETALAAALATGVLMLAPTQPGAAQENRLHSYFEIDQLDYQRGGGDEALNWEAQGWFGGDYNRAWLKTRGERVAGEGMERAELQLLYGRMIAPFWDWQLGVRYDFEPEPSRAHAVAGIQGLAPYFFEVDAAAFISEKGDLTARFEAGYDLLLTQRLIVRPSVEINFAGQSIEELGIGSGLNELEWGVRFRYEIVREIAPYVGLERTRKRGKTADLARSAGRDARDSRIVAGIRIWF